MSFFGADDNHRLAAEVAGLQREVSLLREFLASKDKEAEDLRASIRVLQDALIAKESPVAYRDMKVAEDRALEQPIDPAIAQKNRDMVEATRLITREIEEPLFTDADDMISALSRVAGGPKFNSLHGNSES